MLSTYRRKMKRHWNIPVKQRTLCTHWESGAERMIAVRAHDCMKSGDMRGVLGHLTVYERLGDEKEKISFDECYNSVVKKLGL